MMSHVALAGGSRLIYLWIQKARWLLEIKFKEAVFNFVGGEVKQLKAKRNFDLARVTS